MNPGNPMNPDNPCSPGWPEASLEEWCKRLGVPPRVFTGSVPPVLSLDETVSLLIEHFVTEGQKHLATRPDVEGYVEALDERDGTSEIGDTYKIVSLVLGVKNHPARIGPLYVLSSAAKMMSVRDGVTVRTLAQYHLRGSEEAVRRYCRTRVLQASWALRLQAVI